MYDKGYIYSTSATLKARLRPTTHPKTFLMTIKPFITCLFLGFSLSSAAGPGPGQPAKEATRKNPINWNNTPLKKVLSELAEDFKVKIYNPKNIEGIPITGTGSSGESIRLMCLIITKQENGHAYLLYENGIVFVSDHPFPPDFLKPQKQ